MDRSSTIANENGFESGVVEALLVQPGETVAVGTVLATLRAGAEAAAGVAPEPEVAVEISAIVDTRPPDRVNLLKNPGGEDGMNHWTCGGKSEGWPKIDPDTYGPSPSNHSGKHRFGISWGWETGDAFQHQTVAVEAGKTYEAGFWVSKMVGSDESVEMLWIDGGAFGGKEQSLYRTPDRIAQNTDSGKLRSAPTAWRRLGSRFLNLILLPRVFQDPGI